MRTSEKPLPFGDWDGHCHSGYSGHGSGEDTALFAARAVELGFSRLSFTEHPLFPRDLIDADMYREIYLDERALDRYLDTVRALRDRYADRLEVRVGFELDWVPGRPDFARSVLERYGDRIDDAVLSLHFLPGPEGALVPLDMDAATVRDVLLPYYGGVDGMNGAYWRTLEEAVEHAAVWGVGLPTRLGHLDVVGRFRSALPAPDPILDGERAGRVLDRVRDQGWALDLNAKGVDVPERQEAYPSIDLLRAAAMRGIPFVYGSDAHAPADVGRHRDAMRRRVREASEGA